METVVFARAAVGCTYLPASESIVAAAAGASVCLRRVTCRQAASGTPAVVVVASAVPAGPHSIASAGRHTHWAVASADSGRTSECLVSIASACRWFRVAAPCVHRVEGHSPPTAALGKVLA